MTIHYTWGFAASSKHYLLQWLLSCCFSQLQQLWGYCTSKLLLNCGDRKRKKSSFKYHTIAISQRYDTFSWISILWIFTRFWLISTVFKILIFKYFYQCSHGLYGEIDYAEVSTLAFHKCFFQPGTLFEAKQEFFTNSNTMFLSQWTLFHSIKSRLLFVSH